MITGGAGFLGSHLARSLISDGNEVVVLDNFYTGHRRNIEDLQEFESFTLLEHDVNDPYSIDCDGIYNLACPASPVQYQRNPIFTLKTNFLGALHALNLARDNGVRVLQASTSEIYGDPLTSPQNESYWGNVNTLGIRACYDEGKRVAESLFSDFHRKYGTDIRIARIFNTYGPFMDKDDGRVVSNFILQALNGTPITIYGDGSQTRSFCYVDDMVRGLRNLFDTQNQILPVNLGNPEPISMLKLAEQIIAMTNSKSVIEFKDLPQDDPKLREPDIHLAVSKLGWGPETSRENGLEQTISYFKSVL